MSGNGGLFPITLNVFTVLYSLRQAAKPRSLSGRSDPSTPLLLAHKNCELVQSVIVEKSYVRRIALLAKIE